MNLTNVTPIGPRVLVKRLEEKKLNSSLIEVIQYVEEPSRFGIVLATGKLEQGGIEVGDTVVTKSFSGAEVNVLVEGTPLTAFMLMESDVLAVVEE